MIDVLQDLYHYLIETVYKKQLYNTKLNLSIWENYIRKIYIYIYIFGTLSNAYQFIQLWNGLLFHK
jgi:hypothetical protein